MPRLFCYTYLQDIRNKKNSLICLRLRIMGLV